MNQVGISAIALATTSRKMALAELAALREVDPAKYQLGLGCDEMALCGADEDAASLAVQAAREALEMWGGDASDIGLLVVGTETAADMSRPLSGWVAEGLGLKGNFRSYEVKHACFGGTAAVRQATEWVASGAARGKALGLAARFGGGRLELGTWRARAARRPPRRRHALPRAAAPRPAAAAGCSAGARRSRWTSARPPRPHSARQPRQRRRVRARRRGGGSTTVWVKLEAKPGAPQTALRARGI